MGPVEIAYGTTSTEDPIQYYILECRRRFFRNRFATDNLLCT